MILCLAILTSIIYYLLDVDNQVVTTCFFFNVTSYYFFQKNSDKETAWGCIKRRFSELYFLSKLVLTIFFEYFLRICNYIIPLLSSSVREDVKKYLAKHYNNSAKDVNLRKLREKGFKKDEEEEPVKKPKELPGLVASSNESSSDR